MPDGYSPKLVAAVMLPLMILGLRGLLSVLPRIDPKGGNYQKFAGTYWLIFNGVIAFRGVMHLATLAHGVGAPVRMDRVVGVGVGVLLVVIGNYLTRVEPNWFIGIRTPWTLSSDRVWDETHRLGSVLFMVSGVFAFIGSLFGGMTAFWFLFVPIIGSTLITLVYSYVLYQREVKA